jgi:ribosomal protein S18 acetylase RimI-like enzyme
VNLRFASLQDVPLLAELNRQLIEDERASNAMSIAELEARMRAWLEGEYRAALFEVAAETVAYALFRPTDEGIYLRQFFVARSQRRKGHGRRAIRLLREQLLQTGQTLELDVLVHNDIGLAFWRALGFREHALSFRVRG